MANKDHKKTEFDVLTAKIKVNREIEELRIRLTNLAWAIRNDRLSTSQLQGIHHIHTEIEKFSAAVEEINFEIAEFWPKN